MGTWLKPLVAASAVLTPFDIGLELFVVGLVTPGGSCTVLVGALARAGFMRSRFCRCGIPFAWPGGGGLFLGLGRTKGSATCGRRMTGGGPPFGVLLIWRPDGEALML